jgi:hypothetical protein
VNGDSIGPNRGLTVQCPSLKVEAEAGRGLSQRRTARQGDSLYSLRPVRLCERSPGHARQCVAGRRGDQAFDNAQNQAEGEVKSLTKGHINHNACLHYACLLARKRPTASSSGSRSPFPGRRLRIPR